MVEQKVMVVNKTGLHARPASQLVNTTKNFKSKISLIKDEKTANAKSIINILAMNLCKGTEVTVRAEGEDEQEALDTIVELISSFDE